MTGSREVRHEALSLHDRRATLVAPARAPAEPLSPARPERRSTLMAPIPRLLADSDMSLFDLPHGDVRPWMADRPLSHGIAMACRPRSSFSVCRPLVRRHAPGRPYEGPDHLILFRVACREILSMRLPASVSGRYRRRDGWHEGATSGRSARRDCAHPPSSAIVGTYRTSSTGSRPPGRRRVRSRSSLDDGRPPATPASREMAFCTMPPGRHAPGAAIEGNCGP